MRFGRLAVIKQAEDFKKEEFEPYTWPMKGGDDKELESVISIDIDIFSKGNFLAIEDKVKESIKDNEINA